MDRGCSLKQNNRGASLLAVLITLVFVATIGIVITNITITNIQMKAVEQKSKISFYSAETAMEEMTAAIGDVAKKAMGDAYNTVVMEYGNALSEGSGIQAKFQKCYMDELLSALWMNSGVAEYTYKTQGDPAEANMSKADYPNIAQDIFYLVGKYDIAEARIPSYLTVSGTETSDESGSVTIEIESGEVVSFSTKGDFHLDFEKGIFVLKDVKVSYTSAEEYNTTIQTDIVLNTPVLNFSGSSSEKEFMKYSLIADDAIVINSGNVTVKGNVYAGPGGIISTGNYYNDALNASSQLLGNTIVTRGDITVHSNSNLIVGAGNNSNIWAENIETTGTKPTDALDKYTGILTINGNCYVADDITMNAANSKISLNGKYYGYNFQKDYVVEETNQDSSFSSAMIINAKNASLDMSGLSYLMLAGRTYISKGTDTNVDNKADIPLGESVSVRTNQLAYAVPEVYLTIENQLDGTITANFSAKGKENYSRYVGVEDILTYLDAENPIVTYYYHYTTNGTNISAHRFYLNFASDQKANDFFQAIFANNGSTISANAIAYAGENAIRINDSLLYTLKGDLMYAQEGGGYDEISVTINENLWKAPTQTKEAGAYWSFSNNLAMKYKSLQLSLQETNASVRSSNVRFTADGKDEGSVDKSITPLVLSIVNLSKLSEDLEKSTVVEENEDGTVIVLSDEDTYLVPVTCEKGLIAATGDVVLSGNFEGIILAGGNIRFDGAGGGATLISNEVLVSKMFLEDQEKEDSLFTKYFYGYETVGKNVVGQVQQSDFLVYDNWKKNYDVE